jgi:thiol-disulfide isomerase/thioredoxin
MRRLQTAFAVALWLGCQRPEAMAAGVSRGDSRDDVIAALGEPQGELMFGPRLILTYEGGVVEIRDGKVVFVSPDFDARVDRRRTQAAFEAEQRAKGLQLHEGQWLSPEQIAKMQKQRTASPPQPAASAPARSAPAAAPPSAVSADDVAVIAEGGKQVDLARVVVPGKITIVDFYAEWCGPCRRISPLLEQMARSDADVVLRKIDIVKWQTPVTAQYAIRSVPNIRVFDRSGRMVGQPTSSLQEVQRLVQRAK